MKESLILILQIENDVFIIHTWLHHLQMKQ